MGGQVELGGRFEMGAIYIGIIYDAETRTISYHGERKVKICGRPERRYISVEFTDQDRDIYQESRTILLGNFLKYEQEMIYFREEGEIYRFWADHKWPDRD